MSTSKSKRRECDSPVRVLDKQTDDQQLKTAEPSNANNSVQLEFLQFLKSLDEVPHEIENAATTRIDLQLEQEPHLNAETETEQEREQEFQHEQEPEQEHEQVQQQELELNLQQEHSEVNVPSADAVTQLPQKSLLTHNFIHKLHLAASSEQVTFLSWALDGQQLQLDYIGLQEHLSGAQRMFRSHSLKQFTRQLLNVGFERVLKQDTEPQLEPGGPKLYYQHANFKSEQLEQLLLIPTPQFEQQAAPKFARACLGTRQDTRRPQSSSSRLQLARCRFHTLLSYHNDVRLLQEREPNAEQLLPRRGRISSSRLPMQSSLAPALASKHMNPRDSVLQFEAGQVPEYAGFYGRVEPSLINEFFAEYLPRYGARTSGYKDIVVDASKANAFQQNLPIGIMYSEDEDDAVDQDSHEATALTKGDDVQIGDSFHPPPEDIELEQVMQELCGVGVGEGGEGVEDLEKKELTPLKPKLKRKKLARKCAITETDAEPDSHNEDNAEVLLQAAAAAAAYTKDDPRPSAKDKDKDNDDDDNDVNYSTNDADKDLKCQTAPKGVSKRRRYDLRNSKSKRSR